LSTLIAKVDARAAEATRAGYRNAHGQLLGDEMHVRARAECGRVLSIPLDGPLPVCGETCDCPVKRRTRDA
jgi:hypothetical protein